ncbi:hypothetical protein HAX54_005928 [Datura stramonium]|uniref:Uncharacterized protein n=1 Tax=Datura stramonium TaxID=4076 RepID=A0ABS8T9N8_DATST|nr:hypothetical protein [Datura stramonium]
MEVMAGGIEENYLWKKTPNQDLNFQESILGSSDVPKHVLIVMDALKEFSIEPIEWVLKNVALKSCCSVTILGMMPWLNIPRIYTSTLGKDVVGHLERGFSRTFNDQREEGSVEK